LRDPDWFRLHQPEVGETIWLDMPEMGVEGEALVEAIDEAPEIETGFGRVITATFAHSTGECLEFDIEGESTPLRVTGGHPLWRESAAEANLDEEWSKCCNSLDAAVNSSCGCEEPSIYSLPVEAEKEQAFAALATAVRVITLELLAPEEQTWVEAEEFQPGDSLKSLNGLRQITNRHLDRTIERVYNIEVDGDHVYRVGQSGLLVHNASIPKSECARGIKEVRDQFSIEDFRTVAYAEVTIGRDYDELISSSGPDVPGTTAGPTSPIFDPTEVGGWVRDTDAEYKILEEIASRLIKKGCPQATVRLCIEATPCRSCANVISHFRKMFPHVKLLITHL